MGGVIVYYIYIYVYVYKNICVRNYIYVVNENYVI